MCSTVFYLDIRTDGLSRFGDETYGERRGNERETRVFLSQGKGGKQEEGSDKKHFGRKGKKRGGKHTGERVFLTFSVYRIFPWCGRGEKKEYTKKNKIPFLGRGPIFFT